MSEEKSNMTKREWIFLLVILSLAQFIVHASAFVYYGKGSALTYWSLVGTSISIILALLAIIWSFIQNLIQQKGSATISSQVERLQSVVLETTKSGAQFSNQLERLEEIRTNLQEACNLTRQSREDIAVMGKQVEATQKLVEGLSREPTEQPPTPQLPGVPGEYLSDFYARSSLAGALVVYTCYLSHKNRVAFDLTKVCGAIKYLELLYAHGYLVACSSAGVLDFTEANKILNVTEFSEVVARDIRKNLLDKVARFEKEVPDMAKEGTKAVETIESMLTQ